ncbi:MAG: hypothetical protein U9R50_01700 [Campylobacterota bacterium]|nr:hypothetical protein [Campylobacterota bacterium]
MSALELKGEVDTLIKKSGYGTNKQMRCSILRVLNMRHKDLNQNMANGVVEKCLQVKI